MRFRSSRADIDSATNPAGKRARSQMEQHLDCRTVRMALSRRAEYYLVTSAALQGANGASNTCRRVDERGQLVFLIPQRLQCRKSNSLSVRSTPLLC